jgi:hypothetical protein
VIHGPRTCHHGFSIGEYNCVCVALVCVMEGEVTKKSSKRKAGDLQYAIPDELQELIPQSRLYAQLQLMEHKIDAVIHRRKLDANAALAGMQASPMTHTVRLTVSHVLSDEHLSFVIHGRFIDATDPTRPDTSTEAKFGQVFSKILISFDQHLFDNNLVEWVKNDQTSECDGIEIKRVVNQPLNSSQVKIQLNLDFNPPRYKLNPHAGLGQLAPLLGLSGKQDTRSHILRSLWTYIKLKGLIDKQNPVHVNCDELLEAAFGVSRLHISDIQKRVHQMLQPCDPIEITYNMILTPSEELPAEDLVYDVAVEVSDPPSSAFTGWFERVSPYTEEVDEFNHRIAQVVERVNKHKRRLEFLQAFSQSPVDVIRALVANQCRDLSLMSEHDLAEEAQRSTAYYTSNGEWVGEAVDRYLASITDVSMNQ